MMEELLVTFLNKNDLALTGCQPLRGSNDCPLKGHL